MKTKFVTHADQRGFVPDDAPAGVLLLNTAGKPWIKIRSPSNAGYVMIDLDRMIYRQTISDMPTALFLAPKGATFVMEQE